MSRWRVEIRPYSEDESDPGFRRMEAQSEHDARRIDRGANINLNHEKYYTRIIEPNAVEEKPELSTPQQDQRGYQK